MKFYLSSFEYEFRILDLYISDWMNWFCSILIKIELNLLLMFIILEVLWEILLVSHWFVLEHAIVVVFWIGFILTSLLAALGVVRHHTALHVLTLATCGWFIMFTVVFVGNLYMLNRPFFPKWKITGIEIGISLFQFLVVLLKMVNIFFWRMESIK